MKRTDLERQLKAMGWRPLGQVSGKGTMAWFKAGYRIAVNATDDLIVDEYGAYILKMAKEVE